MTNLISILIPNYNKALYLKETLDSIVNQTYSNWECIIVDDHSTDNSWEILTEYVKLDPRFRLFKRPTDLPKGGNFCRNYAFEQSTGDFIQWFDSDDALDSKALELKIEAMLDDSLDFVVSIDKESHKYSDWLKGFINSQASWLSPGALILKAFLEKSNIQWATNIKIGQDRQYNFDLVINSSNFKVIEKGALWYRCNVGDTDNIGSMALQIDMIPSYAKLFVYFHKQLLRFERNELLDYLKLTAINYFLYLRKNIDSGKLNLFVEIIENQSIISKSEGIKLRYFDSFFRIRREFKVPFVFGLYRQLIFNPWYKGLTQNAES